MFKISSVAQGSLCFGSHIGNRFILGLFTCTKDVGAPDVLSQEDMTPLKDPLVIKFHFPEVQVAQVLNRPVL